MKHLILSLFTLHFSLITLHAAVPLRWTVETSRATPAQFEAYQGETLALEAALQSYGKPLEAPSSYSLYWQTNGMGNAWWSVPCTVPAAPSLRGAGTNVLFATWSPTNDVGAKAYNCFIGQPGTIYHAAFQLRLRPSPGATPNELPLPQKVIDFAKVTVLNPPWSGGGGGGSVDTNAVREIVEPMIATATNALPTKAEVGEKLGTSGSWTVDEDWKIKNVDDYDIIRLADYGWEFLGVAESSRSIQADDGYYEAKFSGSTGTYFDIGGGNSGSTYVRAYGFNGAGSGTVSAGYLLGEYNLTVGSKLYVDDYGATWNGSEIVYGISVNRGEAQHGDVSLTIPVISATDTAFSNAVMGVASHTNAAFAAEVLAVGLNIDTNAVIALNGILADTNVVAVIGEIAGWPVDPTTGATTIGSLLAALAAAVYFLKRKTSHLESDGTADDTFAADILKNADRIHSSDGVGYINGDGDVWAVDDVVTWIDSEDPTMIFAPVAGMEDVWKADDGTFLWYEEIQKWFCMSPDIHDPHPSHTGVTSKDSPSLSFSGVIVLNRHTGEGELKKIDEVAKKSYVDGDMFADDLLGKPVAKAKVRYALSTTSSATMADRTVNILTMTQSETLTFPTTTTHDNKTYARDFLLKLTYTSGTMELPQGVAKVGDELSFEAGKTYLIAFTEIAADKFYVRAIDITEAQA